MRQAKLRFEEKSPVNGRLPIRPEAPVPVFKTGLGSLFQGDCLDTLPYIEDESVDTVFADPPFNLGKEYGGRVNDNRQEDEYLEWCRRWIDQCHRVLKPGGSFFIYNLPRWNIPLGHYLMEKGMTFRHWIAVSIKMILPIQGRLYPAHYSLLYYSKGKPKTFRSIRTAIQTFRTCGTRNSSRHTSSTHLPSAYNRVFGTSPVGRMVPDPSPEGSTRRVIMRRSRTTTVPPRARSGQPVPSIRASFGSA